MSPGCSHYASMLSVQQDESHWVLGQGYCMVIYTVAQMHFTFWQYGIWCRMTTYLINQCHFSMDVITQLVQ